MNINGTQYTPLTQEESQQIQNILNNPTVGQADPLKTQDLLTKYSLVLQNENLELRQRIVELENPANPNSIINFLKPFVIGFATALPISIALGVGIVGAITCYENPTLKSEIFQKLTQFNQWIYNLNDNQVKLMLNKNPWLEPTMNYIFTFTFGISAFTITIVGLGLGFALLCIMIEHYKKSAIIMLPIAMAYLIYLQSIDQR